MTAHILERLAETNPECEIWWDSSPLVYDGWKKAMLDKAPAPKRDAWQEQLTRLFDPKTVSSHGSAGFRGVTTNPPLSLQALQSDPDFWITHIRQIAAQDRSAGIEEIYWRVYLDVVRRGAAMILPIFENSGGKYGYVSGQVDPRFVSDYDHMLAQGLELARLSPNVMVKIPGSAEGYRVIEELTARGISTNNTTSFTVPQYMTCMKAVSSGLKRAQREQIDISRWRSVITHMSARLGHIGDLKQQAELRGIDLSAEEILHGELAVFKRAYFHGKETGHPSKMLQCSMRVVEDKSTGAASSWHIEKLAGSDVVYTCPPKYIGQLMEAEDRMAPFDPNAIYEEAPAGVIDKLLQLPYFRQAYEFDGMEPSEFGRFGAFVATAAEFAGATRKTLDFVAFALEKTQDRAA